VSWKAARAIFYVGTAISLILILLLTVDTYRQISTLTHADKLSSQVLAGKRGMAEVQLQRLPYDPRVWFILRAGHDQGLLASRGRRHQGGYP
jgi:hypothetical protein